MGTPGTDHVARVTDIDGVHNVRDLGRLPVANGGTTATGRLYRSEFATFAAAQGEPPTNPLGLRTVVDLRRFSETRHEWVEWESVGVRYVHCPLALAGGDTFSDKYPQYLMGKPEVFVTAIRALADPANHPALFHCAAGKDRTGVVAAVLLDVVGVARDDIALDYELTTATLRQVLDRMRDQEPYRETLTTSTFESLLPRAETILHFLDWLDEEWGGAPGWLTQHGMSEAQLEAFRADMIEMS
jgi:protein-tyrosine phosphatase